VLRGSGLLVFTVEELAEGADPGFLIQPHGRYQHSEEYVRDTLAAARFAVLSIKRAHLRAEKLESVMGLVVTAQTAGGEATTLDEPAS